MQLYRFSASPHIRDRVTSQADSCWMCYFLVPRADRAITVFGLGAALVVFVCSATVCCGVYLA